jgi:hypothetical protein
LEQRSFREERSAPAITTWPTSLRVRKNESKHRGNKSENQNGKQNEKSISESTEDNEMKESEYETAGNCNSGNNPTGRGKGNDGDGDEGVDTQGKSSSLPGTDAGDGLSLGGFYVQP